MEELGGVDGLGAQPVHLLAVAHGVGVGDAEQCARTYVVVQGIVHMLLGEGPPEGVGLLLNSHQILRQILLHLAVEPIVVGELALVPQQAVHHHAELHLLLTGEGDAGICQLGQRRFGVVDEAQHIGAGLMEPVDGVDHLCCAAGHGRDHHQRAFP